MVSTLKLPVGIDSFEKIRRNNFYYIDKTKLIEQLVETGGEVTLFTRPRRFGKTLNMSMLKSFFEIGTDESLFDGLYISGNKELCDKYMGKYPVIFLSLKSAEGRSFDDARYMITELIGREAEKFKFRSIVRLFQKTIRTGIGLSFRCVMVNIRWMSSFLYQVCRVCRSYCLYTMVRRLLSL